jgi:hypothetical protein
MRSVMSRVTLAKPTISPVSFRIGSMTTEAQKRVPSLRRRLPAMPQHARRNPGRPVLLEVEAAEVLANDLVGGVALDAFGRLY